MIVSNEAVLASCAEHTHKPKGLTNCRDGSPRNYSTKDNNNMSLSLPINIHSDGHAETLENVFQIKIQLQILLNSISKYFFLKYF